MARTRIRWATRAALVALSAAALANAGCLVAAVGAAAGAAGAAGYLYYTAPLVRDYPSSYGDTLAAVKAALAELQFPLVKEQPEGGGTLIETRTGDGAQVLVTLDMLTSPVPADGSATRVSVRRRPLRRRGGQHAHPGPDRPARGAAPAAAGATGPAAAGRDGAAAAGGAREEIVVGGWWIVVGE